MAKCKAVKSKQGRKRCVIQAKRAYALKACTRKPRSKRSKCMRTAKRRYR